MRGGTSLARAVDEAARQINSPRDLPTTCATIVDVARTSLPGIDHAGVTLAHRDGTFETVAATDDLVHELGRLQRELGEGPGLHVIGDEQTVLVEHAPHEQRWPAYVAEAVRRGVCAQLSLRLHVDEETLGSLDLYATGAPTIPAETVELAELFATTAALALGGVRERSHLVAALETRQQIGTATGIVMERFGLDEQRAFEYLTRVSQHGNIKLRDVARRLVDEGNGRPAGEG